MSRGVRGRRFALHHLWKKIPRRRAQLRGAKARTARYMRWLFSQKKDSIPSLLKYFLDHLRLVGGLIPPRTLCGKSTPQGRTLCWRLLLSFGGLGFQILRSSPLPSPVILLYGGAHSLGWNWQRWGPAFAHIIPPCIFLRGLRARCELEHLFQYRIFQTLREGGRTPNQLRLCQPVLVKKQTLRNNFITSER